MTHMLWRCQKIQDFWSEIPSNVTKIIGGDMPFSQRLYALGDPSPLDDLPSHVAEWNQVTLMLERKLIISEWKPSSSPPLLASGTLT